MKKLIIFGILAVIFTGCSINKQPEPENKVANETIVEEEANTKKEEIVTEAKKVKYIPFTFYKIVPDKIEVFPYSRLYSINTIDDKKLTNSFYVKGNYIRIEKIYLSEIGDKYGKIVGKNLLVSMDDLEESDRKE